MRVIQLVKFYVREARNRAWRSCQVSEVYVRIAGQVPSPLNPPNILGADSDGPIGIRRAVLVVAWFRQLCYPFSIVAPFQLQHNTINPGVP